MNPMSTPGKGTVVQGSAFGGSAFGRNVNLQDFAEKLKDPQTLQKVSDSAGQVSSALDQSTAPPPPPPSPGLFALSPFFRLNNVWLYLILAGGGYAGYRVLKKD